MKDNTIAYGYLKEEYYWLGKFPIWVEYHIALLLIEMEEEEWKKGVEIDEVDDPAEQAILRQELEYMKTTKREKIIREELKKLDQFLYEITNSEKTSRQVENEIYGNLIGNFYLLCAKLEKEYKKDKKLEEHAKSIGLISREAIERFKLKAGKMKEYEDEPEDNEDDEESDEDEDNIDEEQEDKKPEEKQLTENLILEKGLSAEKREELFAKDYKRIKISPFGRSGAAYYWVKPRYNESKEHAFFCYLIESELKKYIKEIKTNDNHGPDIEFEHKGKRYCFDVETGKNLTRHPSDLEDKFSRYRDSYDISFILITDKKFKYKYSTFGTVLTRSTFKDAIKKLFS